MNEPTRRFRLVAILAPLIALALGSFWLMEVMRRSQNESGPHRERAEPDFFVEEFSFVKLGPSGRAQYHFAGARLTHNPQDDSYDIVQPVIHNVGNAQSPMTMRSKRAHVNSDYSQVELHDNVHLDRPGSPQREHLHITSEYILVLPDDDVMRSDKPVEITFGESTLTGTGMFVNNATREFRLMSNVHGTYQGPAH